MDGLTLLVPKMIHRTPIRNIHFQTRMNLVLCVLLLLTGFTAFAQDYQSLITEGDRLDSQNLNAKAMEKYQAAMAIQKKDPEIYRRIAKQYAQLMSDTKSAQEKRRLGTLAVDYAKHAVELDPKNAEARLSLAICYGKLAETVGPGKRIEYSRLIRSEAEKAAALNPNSDYAWHVLGRWHYEMANLNPALRAIARTLYGQLPDASNDKAIEFLERAKRVGPPRVVHHIELGRSYLAADRKEEARKEIEKGLSLPSTEKDDEETKARGRESLRKIES